MKEFLSFEASSLSFVDIGARIKLIFVAGKESGAVAASVYMSYVVAAGRSLSALILLSLLLMQVNNTDLMVSIQPFLGRNDVIVHRSNSMIQASRNVSDWWLSYWVEHLSSEPDANVTSVRGNAYDWLFPSSSSFLFF